MQLETIGELYIALKKVTVQRDQYKKAAEDLYKEVQELKKPKPEPTESTDLIAGD